MDAYHGPTELKVAVEAGEPRRLEVLADDAHQLQVVKATLDMIRSAGISGCAR